MDGRRLERLKALTERVASRRLVASGLFAALAASPVFSDLDADARRRRKSRKRKKRKPLTCSGDSCDGTGGKPCGSRDDCQCYRTPSGGNVCASSLQSSTDETCHSHRDCRKGYVCVQGGPACGGRELRFCKQACYK
jgi:hypothetical protein